VSRRTALASLRAVVRAALGILRIAPPTPAAFGRLLLDADSRLAEAFGGLLVLTTGLQVVLGRADWPYNIWLHRIPLAVAVPFCVVVGLAMLVGATGAQVKREHEAAAERPVRFVCPYWPLRAVACLATALVFGVVSLQITAVSPSMWGGFREAGLMVCAFFLAARHFYCRGVGPYS